MAANAELDKGSKMDWIADALKVLFGGVFGAFGVRLVDRYFGHKDKKLNAEAKKDTQLMGRYDILYDKLQSRIDELEESFKVLYDEHTKCLERNAASEAKLAILESWKKSVQSSAGGSKDDGKNSPGS